MKIKFYHVDPEAAPGHYYSKEDPSPYFSLSDPERSLGMLLDRYEVVIPYKSILVKIDYPLERPICIQLRALDGKTSFTRGDLAMSIAHAYKNIYKEEELTSTLPAETMNERNMGDVPLINRARTNGCYGIWGHALSDLDLHTVYVSDDGKICTLGIDS